MKRLYAVIVKGFVAVCLASPAPVIAQTDDAQAIRLVAIAEMKPVIRSFSGRRVIFDPATAVGKSDARQRSAIEKTSLASALGVEIAAASEGLRTKTNGKGYEDIPSNTTIIRMTEPVISGDSAKVSISIISGRVQAPAGDPFAGFVKGDNLSIHTYTLVRTKSGWDIVNTSVART